MIADSFSGCDVFLGSVASSFHKKLGWQELSSRFFREYRNGTHEVSSATVEVRSYSIKAMIVKSIRT